MTRRQAAMTRERKVTRRALYAMRRKEAYRRVEGGGKAEQEMLQVLALYDQPPSTPIRRWDERFRVRASCAREQFQDPNWSATKPNANAKIRIGEWTDGGI